LLIKLIPLGRNKTPVFYVGIVLQKMDDGWKIQCLRKQDRRLMGFIYPTSEDVAVYSDKDVCKVLQTPKIVRSVHYFADDLSEYINHLR
jgi:hypothetical protein